jgi:hypothetical protein
MMDLETVFALQRRRIQADSTLERAVSQRRFKEAKGSPSQDPAEIHGQWQHSGRGAVIRRNYDPIYSWYKKLGIIYGS